MERLTGRVAIVTGAGRGIGETIAKAFDAEGAHVVAADLTGEQNRVATDLSLRSVARHADMSVVGDVEALIASTVSEFGRLDVLCNNAGIDGDMGPLVEMSLENFERVLAVNLRGVFLGMRYAIPAMLATGGGSIINVASVAALVAFPGSTAYAASKAGVLGMTRVAAAEYGSAGVRVNAICPGIIETPMLSDLGTAAPEVYAQIVSHGESVAPMKRLGRSDEIASLAVYLAGAESSFLTGAAIPVDGGYVTL